MASVMAIVSKTLFEKKGGMVPKGSLRLARAFQPFKGPPSALSAWERAQLEYAASHEAGSSFDAMFGGDRFAHGTAKVVAGVCQHGFEAEEVSAAVVRDLAAAPAHIDFDDDEGGDE
jgi:hypothetical protein